MGKAATGYFYSVFENLEASGVEPLTFSVQRRRLTAFGAFPSFSLNSPYYLAGEVFG